MFPIYQVFYCNFWNNSLVFFVLQRHNQTPLSHENGIFDDVMITLAIRAVFD